MPDIKEEKITSLYDDEVNEVQSHIEWTIEDEIALCTTITTVNERPIGRMVKNYIMASIADMFCDITGKSVLAETIWEKLESMYNIDILDNNYDNSSWKSEFNKICKADIMEEYSLDQCYQDDVQSMRVAVLKDYTRQKKRDDSPPPVATPKTAPPVESPSDSEEEDLPLVKPVKPVRKSKAQTPSAKRDTPKRGTRTGAKDPSPARTKKTEEETSTKKERPSLGGRSLRSRNDDEGTPTPPAKRPRRI